MREPSGTTADSTIAAFSEALASGTPAPGGGAAAAVAASLGASLVVMVVRLSIDRPRYQQHADLHAEALASSDDARRTFLELADRDAAAYSSYRDARERPSENEEQAATRSEAIRAAARGATEVPLAVVRACHAQIDMAERLVGRSNVNLASDLEVAALLCESAARGAASNVRANLPSIDDEGYSRAVLAELDQRRHQVQVAVDRVREGITQRGARKPEGA